MSKPRPEPRAEPEFSHPVALSDIPGNRALAFDIEPDAAARARLARLFDATAVAKMRFFGTLGYDAHGGLVLEGKVGASVTQPCVVTLQPVKTRVDAPVHRRFVRDFGVEEAEYQMKEEGEEDLELLTDPIDLGLIATEAVALELPDYPRAEGAMLGETVLTEPGLAALTDADVKPFASLAALRDKLLKDG